MPPPEEGACTGTSAPPPSPRAKRANSGARLGCTGAAPGRASRSASTGGRQAGGGRPQLDVKM
eukprot:9471556-Pyramimonas_sp.AAC.1